MANGTSNGLGSWRELKRSLQLEQTSIIMVETKEWTQLQMLCKLKMKGPKLRNCTLREREGGGGGQFKT